MDVEAVTEAPLDILPGYFIGVWCNFWGSNWATHHYPGWRSMQDKPIVWGLALNAEIIKLGFEDEPKSHWWCEFIEDDGSRSQSRVPPHFISEISKTMPDDYRNPPYLQVRQSSDISLVADVVRTSRPPPDNEVPMHDDLTTKRRKITNNLENDLIVGDAQVSLAIKAATWPKSSVVKKPMLLSKEKQDATTSSTISILQQPAATAATPTTTSLPTTLQITSKIPTTTSTTSDVVAPQPTGVKKSNELSRADNYFEGRRTQDFVSDYKKSPLKSLSLHGISSKALLEMNELQFFDIASPRHYIRGEVTKLTNEKRAKDRTSECMNEFSADELELFFSYWITFSLYPNVQTREQYWCSSVNSDILETALEFGKYGLSRHRFDAIFRHLTVATYDADDERFDLILIDRYVDAFNANNTQNIELGTMIAVDEGTTEWHNSDTIPNYCWMPEKPHSSGTMWHGIGDAATKVVSFLQPKRSGPLPKAESPYHYKTSELVYSMLSKAQLLDSGRIVLLDAYLLHWK